jgi:hypothetical protein
LARNLVHMVAPDAHLTRTEWIKATSSADLLSNPNIHAGTGVGNVIPGSVESCLIFVFLASTPSSLQGKGIRHSRSVSIEYELD